MVQVHDSSWEAFCGREEEGEEEKMDIYELNTTTLPWDNHRSGAPPGTVDAPYEKNIVFFPKNLTAKVEK